MTALDDPPGDADALPGLVAPVRAALLGRFAAGLALASAAVHVALLDAASLGSLVMVAMALACLPCAWHLWRHPSAAVWGATAAVDGAMLLLHAQTLAAGTHSAAMHAPALMWTGLALVSGQLALAGAAALRR
ncbi:hypothetical protein [Geodermatophilus sp. URMC 64]